MRVLDSLDDMEFRYTGCLCMHKGSPYLILGFRTDPTYNRILVALGSNGEKNILVDIEEVDITHPNFGFVNVNKLHAMYVSRRLNSRYYKLGINPQLMEISTVNKMLGPVGQLLRSPNRRTEVELFGLLKSWEKKAPAQIQYTVNKAINGRLVSQALTKELFVVGGNPVLLGYHNTFIGIINQHGIPEIHENCTHLYEIVRETFPVVEVNAFPWLDLGLENGKRRNEGIINEFMGDLDFRPGIDHPEVDLVNEEEEEEDEDW